MNPNSDADTLKQQKKLVVRIDQDSDENLQALFDSVLNPGDSKRPLQVPFRMRKLPNSFFNPPSASPSASHSRTNSTDSAFGAESQANANKNPPVATPRYSMTGLQICHSRAHSSPASLQQTYKDHSSSLTSSSTLETDASMKTGLSGLNKIRQTQNISDNVVPPVHMKQRSYDVVSPIQLQNELGVLPAGWEQAKTNDGQIYYINHTTKTTQWEDPRIQFRHQAEQVLQQSPNTRILKKESDSVSSNDPLGPLPPGWEQAYTDSGDVYFINHIDRTTSWNDPRIQFLQKQLISPKTEINWIHLSHEEKKREVFKQNQVQPNASLPIDPFLSDSHTRQESGDSGLSLSSNNFVLNTELNSHMDDSMDCISENGNIIALSGLDCPENLVSSLQLEDNVCNEMLNNVDALTESPLPKLDNSDWYKIN